MEPGFVEKPEMTLVGIVGCAPDVGQLDIRGLWERFIRQSEKVPHRIGDAGYELHLDASGAPPLHYCLIGVRVEKVEALPMELFAKVVPAGRYAVFTHRFAEGGFGEAFRAVYAWIESSEYAPAHPFDIQRYDARYQGPEDPESVIEIHVPIMPRAS